MQKLTDAFHEDYDELSLAILKLDVVAAAVDSVTSKHAHDILNDRSSSCRNIHSLIKQKQLLHSSSSRSLMSQSSSSLLVRWFCYVFFLFLRIVSHILMSRFVNTHTHTLIPMLMNIQEIFHNTQAHKKSIVPDVAPPVRSSLIIILSLEYTNLSTQIFTKTLEHRYLP